MKRGKRNMTTLEAYAQHGSTSYGKIEPGRFAEIAKGAAPTKSEKVRVCQGLTEMPASAISGRHADQLARELGITPAALHTRCLELCECELGENSFPENLPKPPR